MSIRNYYEEINMKEDSYSMNFSNFEEIKRFEQTIKKYYKEDIIKKIKIDYSIEYLSGRDLK